MNWRQRQVTCAAACAALFCGACGGGGTSPSVDPTSSQTGATGGGGASNGTTFTISASGVSPKTLTIAAGSQVTFVNNSGTPHDMSSDPHPVHTDCPELEAIGFLNPGQSRSATMRTVRTCGFHDHNQPSNTSLQGTIVVP